ncbi:hypothetical protein SAMN05216196_11537 [Lutimaribacter pacificus]|uniref:Uncharacterized protein n=1 Tax=Lutimaribacter pacificus TaxID=391948 RepID=A0A1H0P2Z1_9RHOB|nr:hypothetical protein [Lutimaribacter pacificus]SDO99030.1 hypothetical protein SAMN05216196_11537 [Lutimaribacter pacificus]SHK98321.1 hypothetical protein SAMN05444142_11538 [Lutimaribacter pacificus]
MKPWIASVAAALVLAGCASPMDRVTRLSELDLADAPATVEIAEPASEAQAETGGLFARLLRPKTTAPDGTGDVADTPVAETQAAPAERRGLFGLFGGGARDTKGEGTQLASLDPDAPDGRVIAPGLLLPYGEVARVCDMPRRDMGREVAKYPERGPEYRLYDSAPGSTAPHSFYLTGFPDGCARQFTGALAMFGSPAMHEQLRYGAPAGSLPYSDTDKAYEKIKRKVCGVGRNKPCGARVSRLERDTAFLTVYEHFGDNARWATILLHGGAVVARDVKSGG